MEGTWAAWTGKLWVAILFTVLAIGELIADKLPKTPNRTSAGPLIFRLVMGGVAGSIAADSLYGSSIEGVLLGVVAALLGAFAGFMIRRDLVERLSCPDWIIAVAEDIFAIFCAIFSLHVITG